MFLVGFLSFFISLCTAESSLPVPVLMWSKDSDVTPETPILAGHTVSSQDFQQQYLKKVLEKTQTVVVFLQDRLSIDDFSHYGDAYSSGSHGDAFSNLKVAMDTANSSVILPSVDVSSEEFSLQLEDVIKGMITGQLINVKENELNSFAAGNYKLDNQKTNVFLVHLHPVESSSSEDALLAFKQNDQVIAAVTKQISQLSPSYTCILTATAPNENVGDELLAAQMSNLPHDRLRRAVVDDNKQGEVFFPNNGSIFVNGRCVFIYMSGLVVTHTNQTYDFFNISTDRKGFVNKSLCSNTTAGVNLTFTLTFGNNRVNLDFKFLRTKRDWKCQSIGCTTEGMAFVVPCHKEIDVPRKMSYHCYDVKFKNVNHSISFKNLQVQPYDIKGSKFSYGYDCVGFFSIPILMGLLSTFILLMILFFGIMAVFSITTMDRFDDPKALTRSFGATTG